ncbi:MAG TPA: hypothetical protein VKB88_42035 [Bryobacteraceae bacterium]|nr:hypothetical protein [Bryobacteraceae bacterium]
MVIPSGQVALVNALTRLPLTADQESQAGLLCNGQIAAPNPLGTPLATCSAKGLGSIYVKVPAPSMENDLHNPQRIAHETCSTWRRGTATPFMATATNGVRP